MENQFLVVGSLLPVASEADAPPPLAPTTFYTVYSSTQAYLQQHTSRVICGSDFGVLATSPDLATTPSSMSGMVIETSTCPTIIDDKMRKEMESWKGKKENASWQSSGCVRENLKC